MKTLHLITATLASLTIAAASASADLTITQRIEQPGTPTMESTMKIKDGKIRNDIGTEMSVIIDSATSDTISLMHAQKMAAKMPGAMVKAAQAQAMASLEAYNETADTPKPSGRTETISGFTCEEYISTHDGKRVEVWVTKDVHDTANIMKQLASLSPENNPASNYFDKNKIDGFPIRTVAEIGPGQFVTMTVVALSRDPIPASEFDVPKGYQLMEMPQMPGQ